MKVLEVMQALPPATGTTEFFVQSIRAMLRQGAQVDVLCGNTCGCDLGGAKVYSQLSQPSQQLSLIHIHALWSPFLAAAHHWARKHGIPVVVTTHGALSPWAMASKRWKKLPYWLFVEKPELKRTAAFHVTAEHEGIWLRDAGFSQPYFIAPLGVEVPKDVSRAERREKIIISVGRIYEVKGLDRIVRAIRILKDAGKWQDWKMVMAGPDWRGYQPQLEALIAELGLKDDVRLPGPVLGDEKARLYKRASIYINASYTENFCQPVAEALTYGIPAIASMGTPWQGLETHACGIWTENDPGSLARALESLMAKTDNERLEMGLRGRQWMIDDFSWDSVAQKLLAGFEGVLK